MTTFTAIATGQDWRTPSTWSVGVSYPQAGDTVIIPNTFTVLVSHNEACSNLEFDGTSGISAASAFTVAIASNLIFSTGSSPTITNVNLSCGNYTDDTSVTLTFAGNSNSDSKITVNTTALLACTISNSSTYGRFYATNDISFQGNWSGAPTPYGAVELRTDTNIVIANNSLMNEFVNIHCGILEIDQGTTWGTGTANLVYTNITAIHFNGGTIVGNSEIIINSICVVQGGLFTATKITIPQSITIGDGQGAFTYTGTIYFTGSLWFSFQQSGSYVSGHVIATALPASLEYSYNNTDIQIPYTVATLGYSNFSLGL